MSIKLAELAEKAKDKPTNREELLALHPKKKYDDSRTIQSYADDCDINKIMQRANQGGTISHLAKFEGVYADFSDFDFHEQTRKLTQGREIFDALPAELRREFDQSPSRFFAYVNDPANAGELRTKLPGLAKPGDQLPVVKPLDADHKAAQAAANQPPNPAESPAPKPAEVPE